MKQLKKQVSYMKLIILSLKGCPEQSKNYRGIKVTRDPASVARDHPANGIEKDAKMDRKSWDARKLAQGCPPTFPNPQ